MADEVHIPIKSDVDILLAREKGLERAARIGFIGGDLTVIATAISEIARNIINHATSGEIVLQPMADHGNDGGIIVIARDEGPGIPNIERAGQEGYSTSGGYGLGLPGAARLMDDFEIVSHPRLGTTVRMVKRKLHSRLGWDIPGSRLRHVDERGTRSEHGGFPRARSHRA